MQGYNGDGIAATSAEVGGIGGVAIDSGGNVYISDSYNNRVRKIDLTGLISTIAGNGVAGYNGDGNICNQRGAKFAKCPSYHFDRQSLHFRCLECQNPHSQCQNDGECSAILSGDHCRCEYDDNRYCHSHRIRPHTHRKL